MAKDKAKYGRKTLYFNASNQDIYEYLSTVKDHSEYICNLIRADLGIEKKDDTQALLEKIHEQVLNRGEQQSSSMGGEEYEKIMLAIGNLSNKIDKLANSGISYANHQTNEPTNYNTHEEIKDEDPVVEDVPIEEELGFDPEEWLEDIQESWGV